jgi:hypothetical protein
LFLPVEHFDADSMSFRRTLKVMDRGQCQPDTGAPVRAAKPAPVEWTKGLVHNWLLIFSFFGT